MRVIISGASGLVGRALTERLKADGHEVVRLVRHLPNGEDERQWSPGSEPLDPQTLADVDALVNLSGAPIANLPWTSSTRREILDSRIETTGTLVAALRQLDGTGEGPKTLVNASAVGYYGDRPGETLDESAAPGAGFLADVAQRWEGIAVTAPPQVRVVRVRTGIVLAPSGTPDFTKPRSVLSSLGVAGILRLLTWLGVSGPLGTGRQVWPWITLRDEAGAIAHVLGSQVEGPVNLAAPARTTAADLGRELAEQMHRPYLLPVPRPVLTAVLGDAARDLLLADQYAVPVKLLEDGYRFQDTTVADGAAQTAPQS